MASPDKTTSLFSEVDANRDGKIDQKEFRNWLSGGDRHTTELNYDRESAIQTSSIEETNRYLATSAHNVYKDPNPRIIRRAGTDSAFTCEQRVSVRYLRPPTPPPAEPLIIREVRAEQPPPLPPLVIHERPHSVAVAQPPLILRERPPPPPPHISGEIKTRIIPALPVPPRSVIIERFTTAPVKPRDIVIERWLPYGASSERRTIVEPAPPPIRYPEPTHTIILHENTEARTNRKFENLGVTREDPDSYISRYGTSLLDSATLVREARNAGVVEDISATAVASSTSTGVYTGGYSSGVYEQSSGTRPRVHTSSGGSTGEFSSGCYRSDTGRNGGGRRFEGQSNETEYTQYM